MITCLNSAHTQTNTHVHTHTHSLKTHVLHHVTSFPASCLSSAIQVALLQPGSTDNEGRLTYNDVLYPRDQDATSAVASSLDLPSSMVPQMAIPGALLEERAGEQTSSKFLNVMRCKQCSRHS